MRVFIISCGIAITLLFQFVMPAVNAVSADTILRVAVLYAFLPLAMIITCCIMTIRHLVSRIWPEIATNEWQGYHYSFI